MIFFCLSLTAVAQKKPNPVLTADSLATGNYKDVLNSFFQLAFDQLASPDKEIRFTGTPFAVMAKLDSTFLIDKKYVESKALRRLNYSFALRLDTAYRFNGFSSGIKYALINKRDETVSRAFLDMVLADTLAKELLALNTVIGASISAITPAETQEKIAQEYDDFATGKKDFGLISQQLQDTILAVVKRTESIKNLADILAKNKAFNMARTADSVYQDLKANFNKNALLTIGVTDTTYKDQFVFSNVVLHAEFLKGVNKYAGNKNDLEFNARAALQLVDDTLNAGRDLKRALFSVEPAFNLVFKTKTTQRSYLELKFSTAYYRNFSTLYAGEERDRFFLNGTIRVRILNDIWVPVEIRYDPGNGNLLGFLNVRANFRALAGAAKLLY
ncbi:hypothetical protein [Longitalea luteola]|uniref:hypothetical protein n=1 Tax=Longitalea luteola TaxID=2812563 RepID=UPI001A956BB8|nr:hypothetical protein [Longitalea luteola]